MALTKNENELIRNAGSGNQDSLNQLIDLARPKVQQYLYRMTLDHHETQDVVQETLIDMAKCLGQLEDQDKFWPWLRRIAFNKLKNMQRKEYRQKDMVTKLYAGSHSEQAKGLSNLISEELSEVVMKSMRQLKGDHRRVLVLRCYEEMTYPEIADIMDRSEFGTRMLFVRAKNALKKKLAKNGLSKAALLTALVAFGNITSNSQAAAGQVTSASLNAGLAASFAATITTVASAVKLTAVVIAVISASMLLPEGYTSSQENTPGINVVPAHMLCLMADPENFTEYWYSFPYGTDGPFLSRFTVRDSQTGHTIGQWFQTTSGNYFYDRAGNSVYLLNHNFYNSDFAIMRLPADSQKMASVIDSAYGSKSTIDEYVKYNGTGLFYLKGVDRQGQPYTQSGRLQNIPKEEYFNLTWAKSARLIDLRDDFHKQGWVGFTVSGLMEGKPVNGSGRIPLYLDKVKADYPWLYLDIAGEKYYSGKSDAIPGFLRPWFGLHSIDSLRRDFAYSKFTDGAIKFSDQSVEISFHTDNNIVVYSISLDCDLIESIRILNTSGSEIGNISFSYSLNCNNDPGESNSVSRLDSLIDTLFKQAQ